MSTDVHLRIDSDSDDDREVVMRCLRDLRTLPDGEFVEDGDGMRFVIETDDTTWALLRVQTLITGALRETPIEASVIQRSLSGDWT